MGPMTVTIEVTASVWGATLVQTVVTSVVTPGSSSRPLNMLPDLSGFRCGILPQARWKQIGWFKVLLDSGRGWQASRNRQYFPLPFIRQNSGYRLERELTWSMSVQVCC